MKNTFRKLRQEKAEIQRKLNTANKTVAMQIANQNELNNELDTKDRIISLLSNQLMCSKEELSIIKRKQKISQKTRNLFYKRWLLETKKVNNWKMMVVLAGISNVIMALILVVGCK